MAAHLDGLAVAGEFGSSLCEAALETPGVGEVFAATVRAIEEKDERRLDKLFALVGAVPEAQRRFDFRLWLGFGQLPARDWR